LTQENQDIDDIPHQTFNSTERPEKFNLIQWFQHFKDTYGLPYLFLLTFIYFNIGFSVLFGLTIKDLFKRYLELEPAEAQFFNSIITLPWGFKVLFGIFIDNVRIFGSVRTIHLKFSGVIMA